MPGYNQYIGMRYVPLIMGTWSETVNYEPLVVVAYNGNSYISKSYVPAGTLPTNETYWMLSANYNAQVEQYRQEVRQYQEVVGGFSDDIDGLNDDIDNLSGRIDSTNTALTNVLKFNTYIGHASVTVTYPNNAGGASHGGVSATLDISNNTAVRRFKELYPDTAIGAYITGYSSADALLGNLALSIGETGSIAENNYSCIINVTCSLRNAIASVFNNSAIVFITMIGGNRA